MTASPTVSREAQLEWEARRAPLAAGAAFLSAALVFGSILVQVTQTEAPKDARERLMLIDEHRGDFMLSLGLQVASYFLLAGALFYLLRATVFRRPETPRFALVLLLLAPPLLAVGAVLDQLELNHVAEQFVSSSGEKTKEVAEDMIKDRDKLGAAIAQGGGLSLALSFVLVSLNAMRAGLLSKFMGILGIIVGALLILPIAGGGPVVQLFWLVAVGVLFLGRWPNGRGPAWETGEALPWPSAAELRGEVDEEPVEEEPGEEAPEPDAAGEKPAAERPQHPVSKKRKRKRR